MIPNSRSLVLTTINHPNACLAALGTEALAHRIPFYVIGDTKTPRDFALPGATYYSIERQRAEFPAMCSFLPEKHYGRKNVGYLAAIRDGATEIQETDDDNMPLESFWLPVPGETNLEEVRSTRPWFNVYSLFSVEFIWPRGIPLEVLHLGNETTIASRFSKGLIVQGLADDNPDVDAIFRLTRKLPLKFEQRSPIILASGTWCPFNSQNTVFRKLAFPLLYLPCYCSFRMTDIWRSFVAQRCLWELGEGVIFHSPTVSQDRNEHSLLKDFEDEIPGYLYNDKIRLCLEKLGLDGNDLTRSLALCYEALIKAGFLPDKESAVVKAWCQEMESN